MRHLIISHQKGVSLMEMLMAIMVLGILSALGIPNMLALLNQGKVKESLGTVQNTLQDVQRQAVRRGQACTLELGRASGDTSTYYDRLRVTPVGCLVTIPNISETVSGTVYQTVVLPTGVKLATNMSATTPTFAFSYQGHIAGYSSLAASGQLASLVVFAADTSTGNPLTSGNQTKKCLMASSMLALFRTGTYDGTVTSVSSANCNPSVDGRSQ